MALSVAFQLVGGGGEWVWIGRNGTEKLIM